ncbi:MAG: rod-determining factor RdfA [Halobacteriota archaeon]
MVTKVARLIESDGLDGRGAELERRWIGDGYDRESLRSLADRFNEWILEARMREAGLAPLDGEVSNTYRLLTDDDVSAGMRTQVRRRLERADIDIDRLHTDFVSHQAIHTYLTKTRDADRPTDSKSPEERIERDRETIQRLVSRLSAVTENTVERLESTGEIELGDVSVLVDVTILCEACGGQYSIDELLDRGGCDCP